MKYFNCFVQGPLGSVWGKRRFFGPQEGAHIFLLCAQQRADAEWRTHFKSVWYRNEKKSDIF